MTITTEAYVCLHAKPAMYCPVIQVLSNAKEVQHSGNLISLPAYQSPVHPSAALLTVG